MTFLPLLVHLVSLFFNYFIFQYLFLKTFIIIIYELILSKAIFCNVYSMLFSFNTIMTLIDLLVADFSAKIDV